MAPCPSAMAGLFRAAMLTPWCLISYEPRMPDQNLLLPFTHDLAKAMIFVDGENLAIRCGNALKSSGQAPRAEVQCEPDLFVWSPDLNRRPNQFPPPHVMRRYYYTSVKGGDEPRIEDIQARLKTLGIETPRVFRKAKGERRKQVDISLATDMLVHATRKHYDVAVLVAGDEDHVPLVRAVQLEGARVYVWFLSDGLSPKLKHVADHFVDLDEFLLPPPW
jgi:NYN domain-containing protein